MDNPQPYSVILQVHVLHKNSPDVIVSRIPSGYLQLCFCASFSSRFPQLRHVTTVRSNSGVTVTLEFALRVRHSTSNPGPNSAELTNRPVKATNGLCTSRSTTHSTYSHRHHELAAFFGDVAF